VSRLSNRRSRARRLRSVMSRTTVTAPTTRSSLSAARSGAALACVLSGAVRLARARAVGHWTGRWRTVPRASDGSATHARRARAARDHAGGRSAGCWRTGASSMTSRSPALRARHCIQRGAQAAWARLLRQRPRGCAARGRGAGNQEACWRVRSACRYAGRRLDCRSA
jgi:hypothetical protein